jgi:NTP pyrophosphatase (non-canonical NTP hydrolase)
MMLIQTITTISKAVEGARAKHPYRSQHLLFVALAEEVGEVAKAILEGEGEKRIEEELAQVAAVCVRMIEQQ